jgi:DNA-binding NarL/FixJ family response regulator
MQKESEMQKKELEFKTQELNMATYYLQQRNELLSDLQENINNLRKLKSTPDIIVKTISEKIKQASAMEEADKVCFKEKFDEAQREFISQLHKQYTMLSTTECRICALLRSGFNTKEIAHLLSSSTRTVENHRANIRNKMNLDRTTNLNMILSEIG